MNKVSTLFIFLILPAITMAQDNINTTLAIVTKKPELDLSDVDLVAIPTLGPYVLADNALHSLIEDDVSADFRFQNGFRVEDVIWAGDYFVIKSENKLFRFDDTEHPIMEFDTWDFNLFPWNEKNIFIVSRQHDTNHIYYGNLRAKRAKRLLSLNENVIYVTPLGDAVMVVTSENIYLFQENKCICLLQLWDPLRTAVATDMGLLFATNNEVCLLTGKNSFVLLFHAEVKKLLNDNINTYILLKQGDLLQCDIFARDP